MKPAHIIILVCWCIFALYWLISSLTAKRAAEHQDLLSALAHRIPIGLAGYLLAFQRWPSAMMNRPLTPRTNGTLLMGAVVCLFGLFITLWARWTLAGNWSSNVTFKQGHELIKSGPYRFVRHPIYTGLLVMFLGTALSSGLFHSWLAVPLVTLGFWIKLNQEEMLLLRHFPEEYPAYRNQVKALIPFVI